MKEIFYNLEKVNPSKVKRSQISNNTISNSKILNEKTVIVKKTGFRGVVFFVVFHMMFTAVTLPLLVFYGPFENVKQSVVGTINSTRRFQFLTKFFFSDTEIAGILAPTYAHDPTEDGEEVNKLNFSNKHSNNVELYDIEGGTFNGKMLVIDDPSTVKVGYSSKMPKLGETTSNIAKKNSAIAAINAGGFLDPEWTGTGGSPMDFIFHEGKVAYDSQKNNTLKRDTVVFSEDGMLIVGKHSIEQLIKKKAYEGVSFGPPLVVNGKATIKQGDGGWGMAPRTAIGQRKDGAVLFLVTDGRSISSLGATLRDIQDIFISYGAVNAANLDGGSSTTMFYDGKVVNTPSDSLGERAVPTVFMVIPKGSE